MKTGTPPRMLTSTPHFPVGFMTAERGDITCPVSTSRVYRNSFWENESQTGNVGKGWQI